MDIEIKEVQEIIKNLGSGGKLSIKEEKYLNVAKLCVQLAAENVALKSFGDTLFDMYKGLEISGGGIHDEQSMVCQQAALDAAISTFDEIETPATDRIVAGIKADGVESGIKTIMVMLNHHAPGVSDTIKVLRIYSSNLRDGADK
ncbi:TPA: hypothetical protein ACPUUO_004807 [Klebsiella pneumoniae]